MKRGIHTCLILIAVAGWARADEPPPARVELLDNLILNTGVGVEELPGEDTTGYATFGVNWGIPLTRPEGVALGLQLGGGLKLRDDNPEWNATFGGFGRNFESFPNQRGAFALLFDYRRTAAHDDLWAIHPILGTTVSPRDAVGIEGIASLNQRRRERMTDSLITFWTRGWSDRIGTEFGAGYEFRKVNTVVFRARAAVKLTRCTDLWWGGDINGNVDFGFGIGLTYRFGGTSWHAALHNIDGTGRDLYGPFPTADFPTILHWRRR